MLKLICYRGVMDTKNQNEGFTLIELMISIVVMAVLVAVAGPSFVDLIRNNRIQTGADNFFTALISVRSEALKRNQRVVLCKSSNGSSCSTSDGWEQGWLSFVDEDADNTLDTGEPIIHVSDGLHAGYTLSAGGNFANYIAYKQDGTPSGFDTFVLCDPDADLSSAREILVNIVGRPRMSETTDNCSP